MKGVLSSKCVYRISLLRSSELFLILKRNGRNIFVNIRSCKQTLILFLKYIFKFALSVNIYERFSNIKFNEILGVVAELFHANRET
jgi:hypothetical protein